MKDATIRGGDRFIFDSPTMINYRNRRRLHSHLVGLPGTDEWELKKIAEEIGLRSSWIQKSGTAAAHFDLYDEAAEAARELGATEVSYGELIAVLVEKTKADQTLLSCLPRWPEPPLKND